MSVILFAVTLADCVLYVSSFFSFDVGHAVADLLKNPARFRKEREIFCVVAEGG